MLRKKVFFIYLLLNMVKQLLGSLTYTVDLNYPIQLSNDVVEIKQFSNSSILIEYTNTTFVMYDHSFKYVSHFKVSPNNQKTKNFIFSEDQTYFTSNSTAFFNTYLYDIQGNQFVEVLAKSNLIICYFWQFSNFKTIVYVRSTSFIVGQRNISSSQTYETTSVSILAYRNISTTLINCIYVKQNLFMKLYCFTNFNQILEFNVTVTDAYLGYSKTVKSIYVHTVGILKLFISNGILFIQDSNYNIYGYDTIAVNVVQFPANLQSLGLVSVTLIDGFYYFLISSSLYKMSYDNINYKFTIAQTVQNDLTMFSVAVKVNLTQNSGSNMLNYVYMTDSNTLYSFKQCSGNQKYDQLAHSCISYSCRVLNCLICNFEQDVCTQCNFTISPLVINNFYSCLYPQCAIFNCTYCFNTTFCSICVAGSTINAAGVCTYIIENTINSSGNKNTITQKITTKEQLDENLSSYSPQIIGIILFIKRAVNVPALRNHLPFLAPFLDLFDDYWYYIYQDNNMEHLNALPNFLNLMYQANNDRFSPQYEQLEQFQAIIAVDSSFVINYQNHTNIRILAIDQQATFFYQNSRSLIITQNIINILVFLIITRIRIIFKYFTKIIKRRTSKVGITNHSQIDKNLQKDKNKFFKIIANYLNKKSMISNLISMLFQGNLIFLSFHVGLQFNILTNFTFLSKINIILAILCGFIIILFGFLFYLIVQQKPFNNNNSCKRSKQQRNKINQALKKTIFLGFKGIAYGFINSILINHNQAQIFCLISIKIIFFGFSIIFPKIYEITMLKMLSIGYIFATIGLDLLLLSSKIGYLDHFFNQNVVFFVQYSLLSIVIVFVSISVVFQIFLNIKQVVCPKVRITIQQAFSQKTQQSNKSNAIVTFSIIKSSQNTKGQTNSLKQSTTSNAKTKKKTHFQQDLTIKNIFGQQIKDTKRSGKMTTSNFVRFQKKKKILIKTKNIQHFKQAQNFVLDKMNKNLFNETNSQTPKCRRWKLKAKSKLQCIFRVVSAKKQ